MLIAAIEFKKDKNNVRIMLKYHYPDLKLRSIYRYIVPLNIVVEVFLRAFQQKVFYF